MKKKSDKTHKNNTGAQDNDNRRKRTEEKLRFDEQRFRNIFHKTDIHNCVEAALLYIRYKQSVKSGSGPLDII
jgi:hypothetical protein